MTSFIKKINKKYFSNLQIQLEILLFDVSLRDGLQSMSKIHTFDEKKKLLHKIIDTHNPKSIEVGSIVSSKIVSQMDNSIELYKYAESLGHDINYYLLVPNKEKLNIALSHNVKKMSFISSFSNSFQKKNVNKTLVETKQELIEINNVLESHNLYNNKLYLSCFNICPIEGLIPDDTILFKLLDYDKLGAFNEICLSDSTGNLDYDDYKKLIYNITRIINFNKISLHLHCRKDNEDNIINIIEHSLKLNITKFDISCIDDGGCSVTMDASKLTPNLNYNLLNKIAIL